MKSETLKIEGMSCNHCVMAVKKKLSKLNVEVKSISIGSAEVSYDENTVSKDAIIRAVDEAGYKVIN